MTSAIYPELEGKVAVVTGAAKGMGAHFVEGLASRGVNVVAGDIDVEGMEATARSINESIGDKAQVVPARLDVRIAEEHSRLAELAVKRFGAVDYWINNAGLFPQAGVLDISADQLHSTFGVNVDGVLFGAQAAARAIGERQGSIINMASTAALKVRPSRATYSISKAAVDHLTRFLSVELGHTGLRVNAIAPGLIETDMTRWLHDEPGALDKALSTIPLGRIGQPADVFDAVLFLLSDSSRYVTGTTLVVDGGARNFS